MTKAVQEALEAAEKALQHADCCNDPNCRYCEQALPKVRAVLEKERKKVKP